MTPAPTDSGVYLFVFDLPETVTVRVGALGQHTLAAGRYGYIGSARGGLAARLRRHTRRRKVVRWHIDHLRRITHPVGAIIWAWAEGRECRLARTVGEAGAGRPAIPRFGASDCRCPGHLFALRNDDLETLAADLAQSMGAEPLKVIALRDGNGGP